MDNFTLQHFAFFMGVALPWVFGIFFGALFLWGIHLAALEGHDVD